MNSCVLMATVIRNPELRYTQDNQTPVTTLLVEFPGNRDDDPTSSLKVVGWGNLATEMQERYQEGDQLLIEGRLSMQMVERPEGFKEKRAELVASRVVKLDGVASTLATSVSAPISEPTHGNEPIAPENLDEIPF
ncbi:single-stranded DNA-binding protein [Synechocystis sp. LKSZ1]|uniref:single-stranded DNA-binding protein n=1 Tax=Synechocystis sp. LKSZ1 TaxID=3144951 RepID=UPI00336BF7D1